MSAVLRPRLRSRTRRISAAVTLSIGASWPFLAQADEHGAGYTLLTPGVTAAGYVTADSTSIQIAGPMHALAATSPVSMMSEETVTAVNRVILTVMADEGARPA